ncbi:MAG: hypothetical protein WDN23_21260 [Edaphobacter sp.]
MRSRRAMTEEMAGREILDPEVGVGHEIDPNHEIEAGSGAASQMELEQVKGERDQLLDRLARLQAEFDNARKREAKERTDSRGLCGFGCGRAVSQRDG